MSKVAFVSQPRDAVSATDAQTGSVTIVMWELAKRVARHHEVVVFAPRAPGQPVEEVSRAGLRIRRVPLALRSFHKAMDLGTGALNLAHALLRFEPVLSRVRAEHRSLAAARAT